MTESPTLKHNRELAAAFIAKSKVFSRFPKVSEQAEFLPLDTSKLPPYAYNPSIIDAHGKRLMTYRYHFAGDWRTRLGIAEVDPIGIAFNPQDIPLEGNAQEDARLFWFHGEVWMSWVESNFIGQSNPKCVVRYGQLEQGRIVRVLQPKCGGNTGKDMEKNWAFFESDENLYCIYKAEPEQTVLQMQGETVIHEHKTTGPRWPYGTIRGGSIVPYDGNLLRFFHSSTDRGPGCMEYRYYMGACLMEPKPPFKTIAASKNPILFGSEIDHLTGAQRKACFHWRTMGKSIVIPYGAVIHDGGWLVSVGINDFSCALVKIKPEMLNL